MEEGRGQVGVICAVPVGAWGVKRTGLGDGGRRGGGAG